MEQRYRTFLTLENLINPEQVTILLDLATKGYFQDGTQTATGAAAAVKKNLQLDPNDMQTQQQVEQTVFQALVQRPEVQALHLQAIYPPILSIYEPGMTYGWHTDSPQMAIPQRQVQVRTDLAMTLFLADPASYKGGELEVHGPEGLLKYKLAPGNAVLYPASALHRVVPVAE
ncbi:MAG TPA: PKHD-type hydroxylase, partial [Cytophagales bacterium]|nr:PKHD-type hydroxylase [Cytophagales bacterium]